VSSSWLQWLILWRLTGSPLGSAIFLLVFWYVVDRFTLGVLPDPIRWVRRWQRSLNLRRVLGANPHDGRARLELAELLIERRQYVQAIEWLKPNLEKGDDDPQTLFVMGTACLGAGFHVQGEKLFESVDEKAPGFRLGEVDLVRGRFRLQKKEYASAKTALEKLVQQRKGTIEGRVRLALALRGLGDDGAAALMMDDAWKEYEHAPRFQRRKERWWAWRARPSRPLAYGLLLLAALVLFVTVVVPRVSAWSSMPSSDDEAYVDPTLQDPDE
jgi:tetratricopeptide (TPR) repeat protein